MSRLTSICAFFACLLAVLPVRAQEVLTLGEAIAEARDNNYAIRLARNEVSIAANEVTLGNAGFLPTVSLSAGYNGTLSNTQQTFLDGQLREGNGALATRQSAGAQVQWTVFDGLGAFATRDRLTAQHEQERLVAAGTVDLVLADVIVSYYDLVRQQAQLDVLREAVALSEERLRIAEARRDLGSASDLEVRQARLDLNADRATLLRQQTTLVNMKAGFNQLLARTGRTDYVVEDTIVLAPALAFEALLEEATARNAALLAARQGQVVAALSRREIGRERFPRVDVAAGYGYSNLNAETGFLLANRSNDLTYGFAVTYDVFEGFNRRRRSQNATLRLRNAELAVEDLRTRLAADAESAYQSYLNSFELIALERENLGLARLNVEIALERFRLGTITSVELREVQETLTQARSQLLAAQFEAKRAETGLLQLSGRLAAAL